MQFQCAPYPWSTARTIWWSVCIRAYLTLAFKELCLLVPRTYPLCSVTCQCSLLIRHFQHPFTLYLLLGMKWSVMSSSPKSATIVVIYSSCASHSSCSLMLRSPRSMTYTPFDEFPSNFSIHATVGALFGGMYAPTTYHLHRPVVNMKLTTFGP